MIEEIREDIDQDDRGDPHEHGQGYGVPGVLHFSRRVAYPFESHVGEDHHEGCGDDIADGPQRTGRRRGGAQQVIAPVIQRESKHHEEHQAGDLEHRCQALVETGPVHAHVVQDGQQQDDEQCDGDPFDVRHFDEIGESS